MFLDSIVSTRLLSARLLASLSQYIFYERFLFEILVGLANAALDTKGDLAMNSLNLSLLPRYFDMPTTPTTKTTP
jgi:hypothetical protein